MRSLVNTLRQPRYSFALFRAEARTEFERAPDGTMQTTNEMVNRHKQGTQMISRGIGSSQSPGRATKRSFGIVGLLITVCAALLTGIGSAPVFASPTASCNPAAGDQCAAGIGDDYPYRDAIIDGGSGYGGLYRECTDFVAWRLNRNGAPGWYAWGNADTWDDYARAHGVLVDHTPALGAVAQWDVNHVATVSGFNASHSMIFIEEYNYGLTHTYGSRWIAASTPSNFLHVHDTGGNPGPPAGSPVGHVDDFGGMMGGGVYLRGWVADPDVPGTPVPFHVYVDGPAGSGARGVALDPASNYRPDVDQVNPGLGLYHGFSTGFMGVGPGAHTLYVYGLNMGGPGDNALLGQVPVTVPAVPAGSPTGDGNGAAGSIGAVSVRGWAFDPDVPTLPIDVHAYVDGPAGSGARGVNLGAASANRPDVAAVFPSAGPAHGLDAWITEIGPGQHSVFLYAINRSGDGGNTLIGVVTATVPGGSPVGSFDAAIDAHNSARIRGWAIDPDSPTLGIHMHAYIDGPAGSGSRGVDLGAASVVRPDVAGVYPGAGANHGIDVIIAGVAPGGHTIYVYAINTSGPGDNIFLGSRTVTVTAIPAPAPTPPAPTPPSPAATHAQHVVGSVPGSIKARNRRAISLPTKTDAGRSIRWVSSTPRTCKVKRGKLLTTGHKGICTLTATATAIDTHTPLKQSYQIRAR